MRVGSRCREVMRNVQAEHRLGLVADETRAGAVTGPNQFEPVVVNAVASALAPESVPVARERERGRQSVWARVWPVSDAAGQAEMAAVVRKLMVTGLNFVEEQVKRPANNRGVLL